MKGDTTCKKWGGLGDSRSLEIAPFDRMHGLVCVILRLAVLIQYQHVMDGQTHDNS